MLALRFERFGPPDVLEAVDVPMPVVEFGSALVHVADASVNLSDVKNVEGAMEGTVLPRVPGRDFAGIVAEGPAEWIGAEVWGTGGDVGFTRDGSHAEAILLPADALVRQPRNLSFEQAAPIGVTFVVAWLGTVEYGRLRRGETVAVIGVGGGVGGAVAQIAKGLGARVVGLDRQPPPDGAPASGVLDTFVGTGETAASARLMAELAPGFETGLYKPPLIAERHPLRAARDAYRAVARGAAGRVALTLEHGDDG